jgi:beta-lactamase regulating signal transducer with metallopeptidase domain/Tol biopolymer transport system component
MQSSDINTAVFMHWLLKATLQGSLLVCLIMAVKIILRDRLSARWHYFLWLVLLVRLALPWAPQSRISIYGIILNSLSSTKSATSSQPESPANTVIAKSNELNLNSRSDSASAANKNGTSPQMQTTDSRGENLSVSSAASSNQSPGTKRFTALAVRILPWLWLTGVIILAAYILIGAFRLWQAVISERPVTNQQTLDLLEDCKMQMKIRTLIGLVVTDKASSPALFGFVQPRILLPQGLLETLSTDDLQHIFLHELAHLKRRDIYVAWFICLFQVLHWFNPLIWFALRRMRADQEMAADALVLTTTGTKESRRYGQTIVSLLEQFSRPQYLPSLAGILENPSYIERRIHMISTFKTNSYRWSPLAVILIIAIGCMSIPDAKSRKTAESIPSVSSEKPAAAQIENSNEFVDPNTGIRFTKFKTISSPANDAIQSGNRLYLSPNGKFMLQGAYSVHIIPLDGSTPFDLTDIPGAGGGSLSPDGGKVVFYNLNAMWLIELDPLTGHATVPAKKLLDIELGFYCNVRWSADSRRIIFPRRDNQPGNENIWKIWTLDIQNGTPALLEDTSSFGILSPDGKTIAWSDSQGVSRSSPATLWVKPASGGEPRKVVSDNRLSCVVWSTNNKWMLVSCFDDDYGLYFVRIADGRTAGFNMPGAGLIRQSPQGRKLLFYQSCYDTKGVLKITSPTGGQPTEFGWPYLTFESYLFPGYQSWAKNSSSILVEATRGEGQRGFWSVPLNGKEPQPITIDTPMYKDAYLRLFSPDGSKLLLFMGGLQGTWDLWVIPVSMEQMKSTSPPVKVFSKMVPFSRGVETYGSTWSPDSGKIAFVHNWDIWVASADGKSTLQLTNAPERDVAPIWSPDSTMIAFGTISESGKSVQLKIVPVSGGQAKIITNSATGVSYTWLPDGKALTIVSEEAGVIANYPISDGEPKTIVPLKELELELVKWLKWSPDGTMLAFEGVNKIGEKKRTLYVYQPDNAKLYQLSNEDVAPFYWSPDSKWISFNTEQLVKVRPEGIIWEMNVDEAAAKLAK